MPAPTSRLTFLHHFGPCFTTPGPAGREDHRRVLVGLLGPMGGGAAPPGPRLAPRAPPGIRRGGGARTPARAPSCPLRRPRRSPASILPGPGSQPAVDLLERLLAAGEKRVAPVGHVPGHRRRSADDQRRFDAEERGQTSPVVGLGPGQPVLPAMDRPLARAQGLRDGVLREPELCAACAQELTQARGRGVPVRPGRRGIAARARWSVPHRGIRCHAQQPCASMPHRPASRGRESGPAARPPRRAAAWAHQ